MQRPIIEKIIILEFPITIKKKKKKKKIGHLGTTLNVRKFQVHLEHRGGEKQWLITKWTTNGE